MSSGNMRRRRDRLAATLGDPQAGMHRVPASKVLTGDDGYERRLVRLVRHRAMGGLGKSSANG